MSSCGLLFVFIYSCAAVFMIVDGQSTTDDVIDINADLHSVVERQARTIAMLQAKVENLESQTSGVTYTRWGRLSCEDNGAALLYKGYAAGHHHIRIGGGSNHLCLPEEPQLQNHTVAGVHSGWLYGIQYNTDGDNYPRGTTAYHGKPTPCAVCYVPQRSAQLMIPASNTCPDGWTREYNGYLMSAYSWPVGMGADKAYHRTTSYICVDSAPEFATGLVDQRQGNLYFVKVGCGTLPCSKFNVGLDAPCVVCTK